MELSYKSLFGKKIDIKSFFSEHPTFKKFLHRLLVKKSQPRPTLLSKLLVNPFVHQVALSSKIYPSVRKDIFPFNQFCLGRKSTVEDRVTLNNGIGSIIIGEESRIGIGSVIMGPVEIGSKTITGQNVLVTGLIHRHDDARLSVMEQGDEGKQATIGDGCFIGTNANILPGVTIGKHSVIGSGSVVTKDVPDYHIAAGNPAKLLKTFDFELNKWVRV